MKKNFGMTIQEIEKYWGSLEAYNEEQRRIGLSELESYQIETQKSYTIPNLIETRSSHLPVWHFLSHGRTHGHFDQTV